MAETATKVPIKQEKSAAGSLPPQMWQPFEGLRNEIDRLFDDFGGSLWRPFRRSLFGTEPAFRLETKLGAMPAVDVVESEKAYELTAELPGMDEKNIDVTVVNGSLTIKGEKQEEKEEKKKDYYLHERSFGTFERSFGIPESVDADKIEANFKKGVLTVTLPKKPEAQKPAKTIEVKAA